ncbi:MAG: prephenate dehydrogenase/arogenate dehydrogenase family protein, partial [Eggerthellaceae bacterium]|nr:prephenate dehydrogenase/arogenate dehydrogenase family protein [Eggerthellaceae bacterium]
MNTRFTTIMTIGLGMIGSSFVIAYRAAYPDSYIIGVDSSEEAIAQAKERGWIDEGMLAPHEASQDFSQAMNKCDLVMIATPVPVVHDYFKLIADADFQGVVTDTCSTKALVSQQAKDILVHSENYIPGHPMAGSEKSGIEAASDVLFQGAHWVLCPDEQTSAEDYADLHEMLTGIGARVVSLPRDTHDEVVA